MKSCLILSLIILVSCSSYIDKKKLIAQKEENRYTIYGIDSINSFYLIYCEKDNQKYKIVSKKETINLKEYFKIKLGESYDFVLEVFPSKKDNNPLTNSSTQIRCYSFDENTKICREDGLKGLFTTNYLKGLYYKKPEKK